MNLAMNKGMSLIEVTLAMSLALSGALGLNLAWSQSLLLEQQLVHARAAQSEALMLLYTWQQAPDVIPFAQLASLSSQQQEGHGYNWQLEFKGLTGQVHWHGVWAPQAIIKPTIGNPVNICTERVGVILE